jgi:hypothetical protein
MMMGMVLVVQKRGPSVYFLFLLLLLLLHATTATTAACRHLYHT